MDTRLRLPTVCFCGLFLHSATSSCVRAQAEANRPHAEQDNRELQTNSLGMKLALIPQGEFVMGAPEADDLARNDEKPAHVVRLTRPFYLGVNEVTLVQFRTFVNATGYKTAAET